MGQPFSRTTIEGFPFIVLKQVIFPMPSLLFSIGVLLKWQVFIQKNHQYLDSFNFFMGSLFYICWLLWTIPMESIRLHQRYIHVHHKWSASGNWFWLTSCSNYLHDNYHECIFIYIFHCLPTEWIVWIITIWFNWRQAGFCNGMAFFNPKYWK